MKRKCFMNATIKKAVFPVAGLGTRFLPATKASPKEMLSVVDKPLIQYAVEEAYAAGIREMIFVTGRNKRAIEDHFDTAYELETELAANSKHDLIALVESIKPIDMECIYIRQPRALGLGHAVLCAENLVRGEPFAVLLADDLMTGSPSALQQMLTLFERYQCSILSVETIEREFSQRYGIISGSPIEENLYRLSGIVEKPLPALAPSSLAVIGRYILMPEIFDEIRRHPKGIHGEIQLTDGISGLLTHTKVLAYEHQTKRFDCGNKLGLLQANVVLAKNHPEVGAEFTTWLQQQVK
jgi:UTP--glucose-1-phosphate uridylyltransferase